MKSIVIIGGGLGGLAAGMALGAKGHKVTLLERFARVGGYATTWKRSGVWIEGVLHEIDDMGADSKKLKTLKSMGLEGVEFVKVPEFYRVITSETDFVMPSGVESIKKALYARFADEKAGIDRFFEIVGSISKEVEALMEPSFTLYLKLALFPLFFKNIIKYEKRSAKELLDECFKADAIKSVLGANLGYYTDDASKLSALLFAVAQYSFYAKSGWFVKGGSQKLSDAMAKAITKNGGNVITNAEVAKIIVEGDTATGVEYTHKKEQKTMLCDEVVNNASPIWAISAISSKILSLKLKRDWAHGATLSPSSFGVYIILKGKKAPEGRNYTTFVFDECKSLEDMKKSVYLPFEKRAFSITDYGAIDSGLSDEDKRLLVIFVTDNYDDWSSLDAKEYQNKKIAAAQTLIKRASQIYPDIEVDMLSYEAATPMTNERYTKNPKGAIYGYAQTLPQSGRFRNKFAKILPNLHNASAWGAIGGGYSGAIYGGLMVGKKIK